MKPTTPMQKARREFEKATTLWKILALALADLKKCERMKSVHVDMNYWHKEIDGICCVCLGGSVIHRRYQRKGTCWEDDFGSENERKFEALNSLRSGLIDSALICLRRPNDGHGIFDVCEYNYDRHQWWQDMTKLLAYLKKNKI